MTAVRTCIAGMALMGAFALSGCSNGDGIFSGGEAPPPSPEGSDARQRALAANDGSLIDAVGLGGEAGGATFGSGRPGDALAGNVNRHLWLASLDTLAFLPILSTDPFTGVIATDWGSTHDAPGERFKINAYVTDVALDPNALRVAVFRQVLNEQGAWVTAEVAPETPRQIEDAILVRARQIRIAEVEAEAAG